MTTEVLTEDWGEGRVHLERDSTKELWELMEIFFILIGIELTKICSKIHRPVH